jgi:hypothetical protein
LFWLLLAKSPLRLRAWLLLLNRWLAARLTLSLLLTEWPLKLPRWLLLLSRRLNSRLTLSLLLTKNPPLRLRTRLLRLCAWLLLLNRRLTVRLTLSLLLTEDPPLWLRAWLLLLTRRLLLTSTALLALRLCIRHLAIAIDKAPAGSLAGLRIIGRLSIGRRLRQYYQGQQRGLRFEHLRVLQLKSKFTGGRNRAACLNIGSAGTCADSDQPLGDSSQSQPEQQTQSTLEIIDQRKAGNRACIVNSGRRFAFDIDIEGHSG